MKKLNAFYFKQLSHTLTGLSHPRKGTGFLVFEQSSHTPLPHSLQWCKGIIVPNGLPQQKQLIHSLSGVQ